MITYVDTSTLIKLLINETGTDAAMRVWDDADVLAVAEIAHVEARAALAAAHRQDRITVDVLRAAKEGLDLLWSQLSIVNADAALIRLAGELAELHGLRGYDAVHLAAAQRIGADVFSSADRRLCDAASTAGFHIANPLETATRAQLIEPMFQADRIAEVVTKDSGVNGVPLPVSAKRLPNSNDGFRVSGYTIQELTTAYKDWMFADSWIFDPDYSTLDPYLSEAQPHIGYITQAIYVKPTTPPTSVAITIGNLDGKPGNKKRLKLFVGETPDEELPSRATDLRWHDAAQRPGS